MVHELIVGFGSNFNIGIVRENEEDYKDFVKPINIASPNGFNEYEIHTERPGSEMFSEISANSMADSITEELEASKITEDHIAELMSGEAEVLKDHNVIGYGHHYSVNAFRASAKKFLSFSESIFRKSCQKRIFSKAAKCSNI